MVGLFTDAPVAGLAYTCTPSGQSGATDSNGQFNFVEGDSCTFRIGNISLPPVTAATVITPREIAAVITDSAGATESAENVTQNLFQFFQSLDSDGDASNGITLPTNLGSAFSVTNGADLFDQPPASFETALEARVNEALAVPGNESLPLEVVTQEAAVQHAQEQAQLLLSGTWILSNGLSTSVTFLPNGNYLFGGQSDDPQCVADVAGMTPAPDANGNGAEYGRYSYDPLSGDFRVTTIFSDSTGTCGFGGFQETPAKVRVLGDDLILDTLDTTSQQKCIDEGGAPTPMGTAAGQTGYIVDGKTYACRYELARAKGTQSLLATGAAPTTLQGSYIAESDLASGIPSVLVLEETSTNSFRYLLIESYGGNNAPDELEATDGIAIGTFTRNPTNDEITVTETLNTIGGDGGLTAEAHGNMKLRFTQNSAGNLLIDDEDPEPYAYTRTPIGARLNPSQLVGSYFPGEIVAGVERLQGTGPRPSIISFFENGEFLLATNENSPDCVADEADKPNGDGIEFGRYHLDAVTGELVSSIPDATPSRRYVDTTGECGLVEKNGISDRVFLRKLSGNDGEGFLFVGFDPTDPQADEALEQIATVDTIAEAAQYAPDGDVEGRFFLVLRPVVSEAASEINRGLNGSWKLVSSSLPDDNLSGEITPVVITILGDDILIGHGSIGEPETHSPIDGIEVGTFNIQASNSLLQFCLTSVAVDTASDAGLSQDGQFAGCSDDFLIEIASDLQSFSFRFVDDDPQNPETVTFKRISQPYSLPPQN